MRLSFRNYNTFKLNKTFLKQLVEYLTRCFKIKLPCLVFNTKFWKKRRPSSRNLKTQSVTSAGMMKKTKRTVLKEILYTKQEKRDFISAKRQKHGSWIQR